MAAAPLDLAPMDPTVESVAEFAARCQQAAPSPLAPAALLALLPEAIRDGLPSVPDEPWTLDSLVGAATVVQVTVYVG